MIGVETFYKVSGTIEFDGFAIEYVADIGDFDEVEWEEPFAMSEEREREWRELMLDTCVSEIDEACLADAYEQLRKHKEERA